MAVTRAEQGEPREGTEPDYRFTLANERTFLAWLRTSLAITAGGFAVVHVVPTEPDAGRQAVGAVLMLTGGTVPWAAHARWRRVQRAMRHDAPLPGHRLPVALSVALAAATLGLLVLGWWGS